MRPADGDPGDGDLGDGDRADAPADGSGPPAIARRDAEGRITHRGWAPLGGRRRWMEPFVLALLAEGDAHGYSIIGQLGEIGVTEGDVDVGQVYKTLRDLEDAGHVASTWSVEGSGSPRRDYAITDAGWAALDEWAAVMGERRRLIEAFSSRLAVAREAREGGSKE